ncbi:MAG: amidohydrolase [Candidatus Dependentiae bacterium]|nr:amidohydrolase [Candidatus Dependentiae bacterium]
MKRMLKNGALILLVLVFQASLSAKKPQKSNVTKNKVDLIIRGGTVITMNQDREIIHDGSIAITNGRIIAVGHVEDRYQASQTIDAKNKVILPGLINGHGHAPMVFFRGLADGLALHDWLHDYIFPTEKQNVTADFVYWGTKLACLEMLQSGVTAFAAEYYFANSVAQAVSELGMRVVVGQPVMDFATPDSATSEEGFLLVEALVKKWQGNDFVYPAISPHAPYTASVATLQKANEVSKQHIIPFMIHLSESPAEKGKGAAYLDSLGILSDRIIAAHVVHPTSEDIGLLQKYGVGVVHCPVSNMKLSSGISPVTRMLEEGVAVGLGTDGAASNNALDMMAEMKTAALLQKVLGKPTNLSAMQVLELATIGGARAIHKEKDLGSIEVGKRADLIMVTMDSIHQIPVYNVVSQLVYASKASDIQTVVVNGKVLMKNRIFASDIDEGMVRKKAGEFKKKIKASIRSAAQKSNLK